ncbi:type IV toxin-antitoxin system AbiEi family antitoxin domain-containing protein [Knoellia sp. 3-2P3]|uniref:type IV toxin-antitoxin system AbiEi family antitoxin domain-containing protein n=1 Tax=unclassified Knoellia TaxID=2618719 RepID=UPI0023DB55C4|nr:type IV toxin-antitoxin system AbiEi family antitoxin domain-containing protein [Knoellia sp. 3-2P3]MDF2093531.1 type IV toxin-antitoxin system AbiEi family antitoxin domain-containing protein [Knoellia sp. 3-2P3]
METQLAARALSLGGVFTTADATSCGVGDNALAALERSQEVVRIGPRAFVTATAWQQASTPEQRHRLRATAVLRSFGGRVVASHHSALAVHDLPFWQVSESIVHVARRTGTTSRRRGQLRIHEAFPLDGLTTVSGFEAVSPALAVVSTALVDGFEAGLAAADAALHRDVATLDELEHWVSRMPRRPGLATARQVLASVEPLTESVGETRTRLLLLAMADLPEVQPQFPFTDGRGQVWARADFLVGDGLVVEFDGMKKYRAADGGDPQAAQRIVEAEKRREDRIRALGYAVVRLTWDELARPALVMARIREGLRQAALLTSARARSCAT